MKYLIDTGVWLWLLSEPERLSPATLAKFDSSQDDFFLSIASVWEISIKWSKGKLGLPEPPATHIPSRMLALGVRPLPISQQHALAVAILPPHHHDPFDRLLIVQAQIEDMTMISADREFEKYSMKMLWAAR